VLRLLMQTAAVQVAYHHRRFIRIDPIVKRADVSMQEVRIKLLEAIDQQMPQMSLVEIVDPGLGSFDLCGLGCQFPPETANASGGRVKIAFLQSLNFLIIRQRNGWYADMQCRRIAGLDVRRPGS